MRFISGRSVILLVLLCFALAPVTVEAQRSPRRDVRRSAYGDCMNLAETGVAFVACGSAEILRQEALLTATWQEALNTFSADPRDPEDYLEEVRRGRQALLDEQRAWIKYKDLACRHFLHGKGSIGVEISYPDCKSRVIADRVEHLRETFLRTR